MSAIKVVPSFLAAGLVGTAVIGTKVLDMPAVLSQVRGLIADGFFVEGKIPGQGSIDPESAGEATARHALTLVSCGEARRTGDPRAYVVRAYRGRVSAFLKREVAGPVAKVLYIVYTAKAYRADPDVQSAPGEVERIKDATHVLIAVLASPVGAVSTVSQSRFLRNLAGGNRAYAVMTADEIRRLAAEVVKKDDDWVTVAD